jgi:hypothetical protein
MRTANAIALIYPRPAVIRAAIVFVLFTDPPKRIVEAPREIVYLPRQRNLITRFGFVRPSSLARRSDTSIHPRRRRRRRRRTPWTTAIASGVLRGIAVPGSCRGIWMSGKESASGCQACTTGSRHGRWRHSRLPAFLILMHWSESSPTIRRT